MTEYENLMALAAENTRDFNSSGMSETLEQESRRYSRRLSEEEEARSE